MAGDPNPKQTLILWAVLGQGGSAMQGGLGFKIDTKDRDALQKAGLIAVSKGQRGAKQIEVTDRGWDWAAQHLDAALPSGRSATKSGTPVLQAWLGRLQAYLRARDVPLAEVLVPAATEDAVPEGAQRPAPQPEPEQAEQSYAELRERVRQAYRTLTGGFNDSVTLSKLRKALPDLHPRAFEEVLTRMHREDDGTTLINLGNPREIEPERATAIRIKGQDMHVLWITR